MNTGLIYIKIHNQRVFFIHDFTSQIQLGALIIGMVVIVPMIYVLRIKLIQRILKVIHAQIVKKLCVKSYFSDKIYGLDAGIYSLFLCYRLALFLYF
jgi:hypothetical protein